MALEQRALVDVQVVIGDADGEVAERIRRDVDLADKETVTLHRCEGSIVPDDVGNRIRRLHVAPSAEILRPRAGARAGPVQSRVEARVAPVV